MGERFIFHRFLLTYSRYASKSSISVFALPPFRYRTPECDRLLGDRHLNLFDLDRGTDLFQLFLDIVGLLLGNSFLDSLGRTIDKILGLL